MANFAYRDQTRALDTVNAGTTHSACEGPPFRRAAEPYEYDVFASNRAEAVIAEQQQRDLDRRTPAR
jgi:hypothetical protein